MATCSKRLFSTLIRKNRKNNVLFSLGHTCRFHLSVVHNSESSETPEKNLNRAIKAHLEKNREYDLFLQEQLEEFKVGKKFLASIMGKKNEMSQKEVDEAIEYLFPSGLFVPRARPLMKPPEEIFAKKKPVLFDFTGRPFHFLFYTGRPNYSLYLHEAATHLQKLNDHELKMKKSGKTEPVRKLVLVGNWIKKEDLEKKLFEQLFDFEYNKFIEVFCKLSEHPYAYLVEDFIRQFWIAAEIQKESEIPLPETLENGTQVVTVSGARRKSSWADVKVTYPGAGRIRINNLGLDYFYDIQSREQVSGDSPYKKPVEHISRAWRRKLIFKFKSSRLDSETRLKYLS